MAYLLRNNGSCPLCAGAIRMREIIFVCCDCNAKFLIKDLGLTDGEYVCEKAEMKKEAVA